MIEPRPSESRVGAARQRRSAVPLRRCLASGQEHPRAELLRFVAGPAGEVIFDPSGKLPGRGLWLSPRRDVIEKACARNLFAKAARSAVRAPEALALQVESVLRDRCLDLIGLARRAGQAVAGFEKVKSRLLAGQAIVLVQAGDAALDGRAKLAALGRGVTPGLVEIELFSAAELGRVFGRLTAVHVSLGSGGLAERLISEAERLAKVTGNGEQAKT